MKIFVYFIKQACLLAIVSKWGAFYGWASLNKIDTFQTIQKRSFYICLAAWSTSVLPYSLFSTHTHPVLVLGGTWMVLFISFMTILYICGHLLFFTYLFNLLNFADICYMYILSPFWYAVSRKSGNPGLHM
jgi:hypothetical protein